MVAKQRTANKGSLSARARLPKTNLTRRREIQISCRLSVGFLPDRHSTTE